MPDIGDLELNRRDLMVGGGTFTVLTAVPSAIRAQSVPTETLVGSKASLIVNGQTYALEVDTRTTLLDPLREHLHLTGSKKGCDRSQCGACRVLVDGRRINSCLTLAVVNVTKEVTTIEGVGTPGNLQPMQASFVKHDGYQCGYCTPGQICSGVAVLGEIKAGISSPVTRNLTQPVALSEAETRVRRMLPVCAARRITNPKTARRQVVGAMTMGVGGALMEEFAVDPRRRFFVNHDLAGYEVPAHRDIPHQEVIFLDEVDPLSSPMKSKGMGMLGLSGIGAAVANAVYNATGIRVRNYPLTLDKLITQLPDAA